MTLIQSGCSCTKEALQQKPISVAETSVTKKQIPAAFQDLSPLNELPKIIGLVANGVSPGSFNMLVNPGKGLHKLEGEAFIKEQKKLVSYLKNAIQIPESKIWANLNFYEPKRIIPPVLDGTVMGRDLLEGDIRLKRYVPQLLDINSQFGAEFWNEIEQKYLSRDELSLCSSFIKVWVCPDTLDVIEKKFMESVEAGDPLYEQFNVKLTDAAFFIYESKLQSQCEIDRLALQKFLDSKPNLSPSQIKLIRDFNQDFLARFREKVVPVLDRAINNSSAFNVLRQCFDALILSCCYKKAFSKHPSVQGFIDNCQPDKITTYQVRQRMKDFSSYRESNREILTQAIELTEEETEIDFRSIYYREYLDLFSNGSAKSSSQEFNPNTNQLITKHFFSGAVDFRNLSSMLSLDPNSL